MDETFEVWSLRAAWANTVFDVKHRRGFEKIAIVAQRWRTVFSGNMFSRQRPNVHGMS
jgi:hypothetical protein